MSGRRLTDAELTHLTHPDDLMAHFWALAPKTWSKCAREGARIYSISYGIKVERGSPIDGLFRAVASESWAAAMRSLLPPEVPHGK